MSRFATVSPGTKTENLAGGAAYTQSAKSELVSLVLTSFVQDDFYRKQQGQLKRLQELLAGVDPLFAAKTAVYARHKFGMRSITHIIAGEMSKLGAGEPWVRRFYDKVVARPDDITEILAYYLSIAQTNANGKKKIAKSVQAGLAKAFEKFDGYQLAKYRGEGKRPSLVDAVNLLHPVPVEKNKEALEKLIKGELRTEGTIESVMSAAGEVEGTQEEKLEAKKEALSEIVKTRKIGYFALLRNLRNILQTAPEVAADAYAMLTNVKLIKNSKVLPFRYYAAYKEISQMGGQLSREAMAQLDTAIGIACENVPALPGKTVVFLDVSGSMNQATSEKSDMRVNEIAAVFAASLAKKLNCDIIIFDDTAREMSYNPKDSFMTLVQKLKFNGGSTNFHAPFKYITDNKRKYDRIIILSDMQGWVGYYTPVHDYNQYCATLGVKPNVVSWDLKGYGTVQFPESNVFLLAGWSEKLLDVLSRLEQDKNALIKDIEAVEI